MSKKQKRRVSQSASQAVKAVSPAPATSTTSTATFQARVRSQIFEFKPDYSYIKNDLKRISIIAGSFLVALIILSFIVPLVFR